jgi:hypothetical protein
VGYSFLVWNVEHFKGGHNRTEKVDDLIESFQPDIFGILEFQAKDVARDLVHNYFNDYDFAFTDSKMSIEILVGWKRGKFDQVLYTQRREFQTGNVNLRPGGLLSFKRHGDSIFDNILFLHTDSGIDSTAYQNRQKMFKKIFDMKKAIENMSIQQGNARFIVCGDLNTMGRLKPDSVSKISSQQEIDKLTNDAQKSGMICLSKSHKETWGSSSKKSELDHVIASTDLSFRLNPKQNYIVNPMATYHVAVEGWNRYSGNARKSFLKNISDHCALYAEVL